MNSIYTVEKLPADKVDQAFPLMQALDPHIVLARWREMCAAMDKGGEGAANSVLIASGPKGHFRALGIVEVRRSPEEEPAVVVSKLFIDSALDPERVARAMLEALASYCKAHECSRLQIAVRGTDEATIVEMANAGKLLQGRSVTIELL